MANTTFFRKAQAGDWSYKEIFSDVALKHTEEDTARMFTAGTSLTTPSEAEMLSKWTKPYAFARIFGIGLLALLLLYAIYSLTGNDYVLYILLAFIPCLVPFTCLVLVWEMHIPRNISFYELIQMVLVGGVISIGCSGLGYPLLESMFGISIPAVWAGLVEEPAKLIAVYLFLKKKNRPYLLNGMLIGFAVGTGFAFMESIGYTFSAYTTGAAIYSISNSGQIMEIMQLAEEGQISVMSAVSLIGALMSANASGFGLRQALVRAFNAVAGHGVYASLFGGALALAKGKDDLRVSHLADKQFLLYFAGAVGLHALNNMDVDLGLPTLLGGMIGIQYVLISVVALAVWFPMLKKGVNQIVHISAQANGGVTRAVHAGDHQANIAAAGGQNTQGWYLVGLTGDWAGREMKLEKGMAVRIGRDGQRVSVSVPGCVSVSGVHCELVFDGTNMKIKDLNSSNGTFVGSQRLTAQENYKLKPGSRIYLADKRCTFQVILR